MSITIEHNLHKLAAGLTDLSDDIAKRLINSSIRDAGKKSQTLARRLTVARGGYDKAGLGGRVRNAIRYNHSGQNSGAITSTNEAFSLARWPPRGRNRDPGASYTRNGQKGVRVRGHFENRNFFKLGGRSAFVRAGANGNVQVFRRVGEGRDAPLEALKSLNPSHVMLHDAVREPVINVFDVTAHARFASKYDSKVGATVHKYGLT